MEIRLHGSIKRGEKPPLEKDELVVVDIQYDDEELDRMLSILPRPSGQVVVILWVWMLDGLADGRLGIWSGMDLTIEPEELQAFIPKVEENIDMEKQQICDSWNEHAPIGTDVLVTDDFGAVHTAVTRSAAQLLGGHTPVVWIHCPDKPKWGCYLLERVKVRKCRVCGCTTFNACRRPDGPCAWVPGELDLCTGCAGKTAQDILAPDLGPVWEGG
jgi:hypothetical protein